ncbi:MAG: aminotransferase class I/II-fold pyridoxal phosphate-dependent enzyme [Ignavibacteriae bacterium]|nr:aminotransferase class I/II-fold pyridoxal phosphate-dependent enzyme [Ignavibacteriota bacterium]NOG98411.1 aminotransferase class I/II-fold pyridoxal phosphate-dependent enzyme [Ignavibacteriota bacterium]
MKKINEYRGCENFDLRQLLIMGRKENLKERTKFFESFINNLQKNKELQHLRCILSPSDREVFVKDRYTGKTKKMLMFGSNNYLGLANHPYVIEITKSAASKYGVGVGGPPLLNGYTNLHRELEERLAELKGSEDALIFSSGYGANLGLVSALVNSNDLILYDSNSHASLYDGIKLSGANSQSFEHNNVKDLNELIKNTQSYADKFISVEGVYSMEGDTAPLDKIIKIAGANNAYIILDDAHGTGVMGKTGRGTAEHYNVEDKIDITMGTFSKTFSVTGGFITSSKSIISYLRFFARSYMFSASLPPAIAAAVLAGLDVIKNQPELLTNLNDNIAYTKKALNQIGLNINSKTSIIPLKVPIGMNIRKASHAFDEEGIFLNSIEYPAVPISEQRFRISLMATHTKQDIDNLISVVERVWKKYSDPGRLEAA